MKLRKPLVAGAALTVAALLLIAAWAVLRSPVPAIDAPTAALLSATADRWCDQSPGIVPPEEWPPEIRQLHPHTVRVTPDGVYLERGSRFVKSWGLFILRTTSPFRPASGTDPSYRPLLGRVYWYEVAG